MKKVQNFEMQTEAQDLHINMDFEGTPLLLSLRKTSLLLTSE